MCNKRWKLSLMKHFEHYTQDSNTRRITLAAGCVLAVHGLVLWTLQTGFANKATEVVIPVQVLSDFITPPPPSAPSPAPPPPAVPPPPKAPPPPAPVRHAPSPPKAAAPRPAPMPVAIEDPAPAPEAPVGVAEPQPPTPPINTPVAAPPPAPAAAPAPAAPSVVAPSSTASYLNNPAPAYPAISRRLNEQGLVVLRVLIGTDGLPQQVEVKQSSGFERLDQAAVKTVTRWRFVPGTKNGVPEAMWHLQPINFVLTH